MKTPEPWEFRIVTNGEKFRVQRYVRVWWKLWLARDWAYMGWTGDSHGMSIKDTYDKSYTNLEWATEQEAKDYIEKIRRMEAGSGPWGPVGTDQRTGSNE